MNLGAGSVAKLYLGASEVVKAYLGADLVWSASNGLLTNLVSYWPLGGTADSHGSNTLTAAGDNTPAAVGGKNGNGSDLETTGDTETSMYYVEDNASLSITGALTISAWIYSSAAPVTHSEHIVTKYTTVDGSAVNYKSFAFRINTNQTLSFVVSGDGSATVQADSTGTIDATTWYHVVAVYEPSTAARIYINGSADGVNTTSIPASLHDNASEFQIGYGIAAHDHGTPAPTRNFDGIIDEVAIWGRALSPSDITALYNSGTGLFYPSFTA